MLGEPDRRDDRHVAGVDVGLVDHPTNPGEVVYVTVGVDDRSDRPITTVGAVQTERRRCSLGRDERIDDDHAPLPLDEGDVGQVEPTDLVEAGHDLEQTLDRVQLRLPPQAGIDRVGGVTVQEGVGVVVPDDASVGIPDDSGLKGRDKPPVGVREILPVVER